MSDLEIADPRFRFLTQGNAAVTRLFTGCLWAEGPVYLPLADMLLWSDIPNDRILQWSEGAGVRVWRQPARHSNGHTLDPAGRLVSCEHGSRAITRTGHDGAVTTLAERWRGRRLNSPNDVIVKRDGTIWFSDPPYGILSDYEGHRAPQELDGAWVFRLEPESGALEPVVTDIHRPNGLAFSPDERILYVADSSASHDPDAPRRIRAYDVTADGTTSGRDFATVEPGVPDGMRVDRDGNVWTSAGDGVHCYDPGGRLLGKIRIPEPVSNLCFGGPKRNRLFITATSSLYAITVAAVGAV